MPQQPVACTCHSSGCRASSFVNQHGHIQPGRLISSQQRSKHTKNDSRLGDAAAPSNFRDSEGAQESTGSNQAAGSQVPNNSEVLSQIPKDSEVPTRIHAAKRSLFLMTCTLVSFLHLSCGLSREASGRVLKMLQILLQTAFQLGTLVAQASFRPAQSSPFSTPQDVRRAIAALSLEPTIIRSVCCPKCYYKYDIDNLPEICEQRESPRSNACGRKLCTLRSTRSGPKLVPECLYSTQDLTSWLEFFLSRPGIEDLIDKSYAHMPTPDGMRSIWDSPAWQSLGHFTTTQHNLTFSLFIDWYNPFGNKSSGKSVSCGCIMLFCLNLPYDLQHLPENTCFVGITPPPKEPSVTTITALADPVVDQLTDLWTGKVIRTHRYPDGIVKRLGILPVIGDLLAIRKALGYAGVTAHNFCSFCILKKSDINNLDLASWQPRIGDEVRAQAHQWKNAKTKKDRKEVFDKHGVRWSSFHRLIYRNHVRHTVLGVMHNWIEGILQHHARIKWQFGQIAHEGDEDDDDEPSTPPPSPHWLDSLDYTSLLEDELSQLEAESRAFQDTPSHSNRMRVQSNSSPMQLDDVDSDGDVDMDFQPDEDSDSQPESSGSDDMHSFNPASAFTKEAVQRIHSCINDSVVPTWLARPPQNLGQKSHGKLKADQWLVLFTVYLPMILPELWNTPQRKGPARHHLLLQNFASLVACTNILCTHLVTNAAADQYVDRYIDYRKSSAKLFPHARSRPNHHFAMHNGDLMKFWGPLMKVSEFPYERHNGALQKIPTNTHIWELDYTMLRQMCRRGRLLAFLQREDKLAPSFVSALLPERQPKEKTPPKGIVHLPVDVYQSILRQLNDNIDLVAPRRHFLDYPHPINATILSPYAWPLNHITHRTRDYSTHRLHPGNSSIEFLNEDGHVKTGFIQQMWNLTGEKSTLLLISVHQRLSAQDEMLSPFAIYPELQAVIVYEGIPDRKSWIVIQSDRIEGHVAYYRRPPGTFGIASATMVLVNALHRNR